MKKILTTLFILFVLVASVVLTGCTKTEYVYVCANGQEVASADQCPTNKVAGVKKLDAESYARNFVNAYFLPYGGKVQFVSSYLNPDEGDYYATFIVSEIEGNPVQTVVVVDGVTGQVECVEKCGYVE